MKARTLRILAAALGVGGAAVGAAEPGKLKLPTLDQKSVKATPAPAPKSAMGDVKTPVAPSRATQQVDNQKLADLVAAKLTESPAAQAVADLQMLTDNGTVTLMGKCSTEAQKDAVLKTASTVAGVKLVRDGLKVVAVKPTPAEAPKAGPVKQAQGIGGPLAAPAPVGVPPMGMGMAMGGNPDVEPLPVGPAGAGMAMGGPPLPNHAWPTYAPYPNMSRVAYPTAHPYNAFPFIGPYYPFPKVPLGWRSVSLTWEDGHWWLGRKATPQDYWRVKFGY